MVPDAAGAQACVSSERVRRVPVAQALGMASKRKVARADTREARLALVVELAGECCRFDAPHDWADRVLTVLEQDGLTTAAELTEEDVHDVLTELGWYCDPDETEDE